MGHHCSGFMKVKTAGRTYPVIIGSENVEQLADMIPHNSKIMVIVDREVLNIHQDKIDRLVTILKQKNNLVVLENLPADERLKSLRKAGEILELAADKQFNRSSWFIGVGGGVIGDLVGLVAGTYMRGSYLVHVPTTLLAQVDSSLGGKAAVNHAGYKNIVGVFYQPHGVVTDTAFLQTLPRRELISGLAEILKYGILCDREFFFQTKKALKEVQNNNWFELPFIEFVNKSCAIKTEFIERDEFDVSQRMYLNLGHTFAHALEGATGYNYFKHGEAVLWGLNFAARLAKDKGMLVSRDCKEIQELVELLNPPKIPDYAKEHQLLAQHLLRDKKRATAHITVVLPENIGKVALKEVDVDQVVKIIKSG